MRLPKRRFIRNGRPVVPDGLVRLAREFQHRTKIAMSFRIVRAAFESFAKGGLGFAVSLLTHQKNTIIIMTLWQVRIDFESHLILALGLVAAPGPGIERNQIGVRLCKPWILLDSL